jgi:N-sulfoglucosamine sulfohydrolase
MRSNILFITADDLDANTVGAFGGPPTITPRLDALAGEGMTLHRAHVVTAVCQPSRSAIMTGKLPHRNGAEGFEPIDDGITVLTDPLRAAGYRVGILGKVNHLEPVERFNWDTVKGMSQLGMGRDPEAYGREAADFFAAAAKSEQPWFLMANAHDPHRPFHGSVQELEKFGADVIAAVPAPSQTYAANAHPVPGFLPDLPDVRTEYAQYLSSARRCDDVVAALLDALDAAGQAENTLVVFISDNGMAFPFAKANCYLQSTKTPLIVRWPGQVTPASRDDQSLVTMLDLFPTFCEAAGVVVDSEVDGTSLGPILRGTANGDTAVVTVFHETSAKLRFEMRCVQDGRHGYIWNHWSDNATAYVAENMEGLTWNAMVEAAREDPAVAARVDFYSYRAREELYDLELDPNSLRNLAELPASSELLSSFRAQLATWMDAHGDPLRESYELDHSGL